MDRTSGGGRNRGGSGWRLSASEPFWAELKKQGVDDLESLTSRAFGEVVTDARSSWVRSRRIGPKNVYVKTYDYSSAADRRRGWGRTTWLARSRARREWDALDWFASGEFPAVNPLLLGERRSRIGVLHRAVLVTEAWGDGSLDRLLPSLNTVDRTSLLAASAATVHAWHRAGWRDHNLDPRNLLARRQTTADDDAAGTWQIAKIDSPRYRLRPAGQRADRASRADWARLRAGLAALGIRAAESDRAGICDDDRNDPGDEAPIKSR